MEEKKEPAIYYKLMANKKVRIFKSTWNDKDFYKIQVTQKNYDGTSDKFYKNVMFKKGVDLPNETDIIILEGYENLRKNPKDDYNPISTIMITKFELCENEEQAQQDAFDEYRENLEEVEITDDFLD